jgi:hypothetical protein
MLNVEKPKTGTIVYVYKGIHRDISKLCVY